MKVSFSKYNNGQRVFLNNEDGGFCIGVVTVVDNKKVKRQNKHAILVKDRFGNVGYVKTKYLSEI